MGLDTSHDCWHGAYSAFRRWRRELARVAGIPVSETMTFDGADYDLPWEEFTEKNYQGDWDRVPGDDPLIVLLAHSDCDGVIHPEHAHHIAKRLRELAPLMDEAATGHIWSMRGVTLRFADGLDEAVAAGEDVVFS